jgi:hypothetical protein
MTEINGLRLAYRGLVSGLAGGYVWAAIAMTMAGIAFGDPLRPLRPFATALTSDGTSSELAFVLGLFAVQAGGAFVGMCFAYFFGRFFTVRQTVAAAAPCVALLTWGLVAATGIIGPVTGGGAAISVVATIGFGLLVGAAVPLRADVARYPASGSGSGSPST